VVKPKLVRYEAPGWGVGEVWLEGGRVVWSELPRPSAARPSRTRAGTGPGHALSRRLAAFFSGVADDFADVELDLEDGFYGDCARALRAVPRGEVVTYGELAALAGSPGAARAAGSVCATNRFWLLVPCHRVVAATGLGGYGSSGLGLKRRLLELEGVPVDAL
jgi:methylated-DNA-[protein]-cysteine S-methyltransferase